MSQLVLITPRSLTGKREPVLDQLEARGFELRFAKPGQVPTEEQLLELVPGCIGWIAGIEPVLDSIEAGEQERGERDVRIRCGVRRAELDSLRFRIRGVSWNADGGGTIPRGISEVDRCFESGDEALVTVRSRVRDASERGRVFQNSANEKERHIAQPGVTVAGEERFVAIPK